MHIPANTVLFPAHYQQNLAVGFQTGKAIDYMAACFFQFTGPDDVVLICGKGADAFQKIRGVNTPYPSDIVVAQNVINELEGQKEHFRK